MSDKYIQTIGIFYALTKILNKFDINFFGDTNDFRFRVKNPGIFTPQALKLPFRVKKAPDFTPFSIPSEYRQGGWSTLPCK